MTLFLVGVTGPEEAMLALAHGADIVHVADAGCGPVTAEIARATVAAVARRRPVSGAIGAASGPDAVLAAATALADAGVDSIEVLLPAGPHQEDSIRALATLARRVKLVGTIVAGEPADAALFARMAESGFAGVMLDTAGQGERLLDRHDIAALANVVDAARACGLTVGLAGALETPDIPRLLLLAPDVLGLRARPFVTARIDMVRALVPRPAPDGVPAELDLRRRAARGQAPEQRQERHERQEPTDRVFVRDFELPMRIGAYAREHGAPQKVRFDVDVRVLRPGHAPEDMSDVFSYDIITDSIRMIAAREHVSLVETLAERIAAVLLAHARVTSVTVRVEKLDVGPAGVGIEITRDKPAEAATVLTLSRSGEAST